MSDHSLDQPYPRGPIKIREKDYHNRPGNGTIISLDIAPILGYPVSGKIGGGGGGRFRKIQ